MKLTVPEGSGKNLKMSAQVAEHKHKFEALTMETLLKRVEEKDKIKRATEKGAKEKYIWSSHSQRTKC